MSHIRLGGYLSFRLLVLCFWLCLPLATLADEPSLIPAQVVFQWWKWYPKDLSNAATLTTTSLRNGLSQKQWVEKNEPLLKDLQFKYLEATVLEEEHDGEKASVSAKVRLFVVIGEVVQVERYTLKNVEGHWLIDGQEIQEDRVIGRTV